MIISEVAQLGGIWGDWGAFPAQSPNLALQLRKSYIYVFSLRSHSAAGGLASALH
jgi:hypothetical protein